MDYVIAIPSTRRTDVINKKTLCMLRAYGIDMSRVYVFVAEDEIQDYKVKFYRMPINLIQGGKGIKAQREAISNYFDEGQTILSLDDDISMLYELEHNTRGKPKLQKVPCLETLILETTERMIEKGVSLAGIYPCDNPFFMKYNISYDLRFIIGQFKIFFNRKACERRDFTLLEDYETTIKYYLRDGGVLRYNNICSNGEYAVEKWGKTIDDKKYEIKLFLQKYPKYTYTKRKSNDNLDLQFKSNVKNDFISTLWIGKKLNELCTLSINSWLNNGYDVNLYIDESLISRDDLPKEWFKRVILHRAKDVMHYDNIDEILPMSDLWRYNLIVKNPNAIWCDADMVLLDRLPLSNECIISSENTFQSGAFKSKSNKKANIGVLKFNKHNNDIMKTMVKKYTDYHNYNFTDLMVKFQKTLNTTKYQNLNKYVLEPHVFCPIPWWNCQEMYYNRSYTTKYNVEPLTNDWVLKNSIGVHMWNNFTYNKHFIDFDIIEPYSLYWYLNKMYYNKSFM